ncbi:hypothetical protein EE612_052348, partial [Oryza sativa]
EVAGAGEFVVADPAELPGDVPLQRDGDEAVLVALPDVHRARRLRQRHRVELPLPEHHRHVPVVRLVDPLLRRHLLLLLEGAVGGEGAADVGVALVGEEGGVVDDGGGGEPALVHPPVEDGRGVVRHAERPLVAVRLPAVRRRGVLRREPGPPVVHHGRHHRRPGDPLRDVPERAPHGVAAEGHADDVELVAEAQRVGELRHVQRRALDGAVRVRVALAVAGAVEGDHVHAQLFSHFL